MLSSVVFRSFIRFCIQSLLWQGCKHGFGNKGGFLVGNHPHLHVNVPFSPAAGTGGWWQWGAPKAWGVPRAWGSGRQDLPGVCPGRALPLLLSFVQRGFYTRKFDPTALALWGLPPECSSTSRDCRIWSHFAGFSGV